MFHLHAFSSYLQIYPHRLELSCLQFNQAPYIGVGTEQASLILPIIITLPSWNRSSTGDSESVHLSQNSMVMDFSSVNTFSLPLNKLSASSTSLSREFHRTVPVLGELPQVYLGFLLAHIDFDVLEVLC